MGLGGTIARGLCLASALTFCTSVVAQDSGGLNASLNFAQGLTFEDDAFFGQTDIAFAISDTTKRENFEFNVNTQLFQSFDGDMDTDIRDPSFALGYGIQSRQSELTTSLVFQKADADALTEDLNGTLAIDSGVRADLNANVALEFGREALFGGVVSLGYADTKYSGTQSVALVDNVVMNRSVDLRFELNKQITATLGYRLSETERAGLQNSRLEVATIGANFAVNPTLMVSTFIGQSEVTNTSGATSIATRGLNYGLSATQQRSNGALSFSLASDISEAGRRTTAQISRSLDTRRGSLSGRFGVSEGADAKLRPLYQLNYTEELPRGSFNIRLDQAFSVNVFSEEVLNSELRVGWQQALTAESNFQTNVSWRQVDVLGDSSSSSRLDLNLSYRQQLSEDWTFLARARRSWLTDSESSNDNQSEIFLGLQAALAWRL